MTSTGAISVERGFYDGLRLTRIMRCWNFFAEELVSSMIDSRLCSMLRLMSSDFHDCTAGSTVPRQSSGAAGSLGRMAPELPSQIAETTMGGGAR